MFWKKNRAPKPEEVTVHDVRLADHLDNQHMVSVAQRQIGFVVSVVIASSLGYYAKGREDKQILANADKVMDQERDRSSKECDARMIDKLGDRDKLLESQNQRLIEQVQLIGALSNKTSDLTNKTNDLTNKTNEIAAKQDKTLQIHANELKAIKSAAKEAKTAAAKADTAVTKVLEGDTATPNDRRQINELVKKGKPK